MKEEIYEDCKFFSPILSEGEGNCENCNSFKNGICIHPDYILYGESIKE